MSDPTPRKRQQTRGPQGRDRKGSVWCGSGTCLASALAIVLLVAPAAADPRHDAFMARLRAHVESLDALDAAAKEVARSVLTERNADTDDEALLAEVLVLVSDDFRLGLDAFDDEDYAGCAAALDRLAEADDPYLRYGARAQAAEALVQLDRLVEAQQRIEALLSETDALRQYTLSEAELRYMLGYCQVQNLQHDQARATLEAFLHDFPDASPRLVVTARQMIAELARRVPESIGEVADLMNFSEHRLAAGDASDRVQETQRRIVDLLDELIDKVEEQEQNQQASAGGQTQRPHPQSRPQSRPDQPAEDSRTAPGRAAEGAKRPGRQVNPGQAWGAMPAAEREKVLQVLRDRFPGRYRALVEQYYQSLAEEP